MKLLIKINLYQNNYKYNFEKVNKNLCENVIQEETNGYVYA